MGRGSSKAGGGGTGAVDLGFGVKTSSTAFAMRKRVNKALGVGSDDSAVAYSLRRDKLVNKRTDAQLIAEDKKRLKTIQQRKTKPTNQKTFVNSFGEATSREITSNSYNRQRRSLERQVMNNLGRNR
jgi:hypothetical protein